MLADLQRPFSSRHNSKGEVLQERENGAEARSSEANKEMQSI